MHPEDRGRSTRPLTTPLRAMPIFRPALYLALVAILLPAAAAGVAAGLLLNDNHPAPVWVPLIILLFIPILAVAWLFMRSVRLTPMGISVGRPFQRWHEAMWHEINRAERRGLYIRISTASGDSISFAPRLLMDGEQLRATVLTNLSPKVLDGPLRMMARDLMPIPESETTGMLRARPRNRWPLGGVSLSLVGLVVAALSLWWAPLPVALGICIACGVLVALGVFITIWLLQEVIVTPEGLTIIRPWRRSPEEVMWKEVRVLEHWAHWALLRFRMGRSVRCIGPSLLRAPERDRMFAFINRYCLGTGVINYPHKGLF